MTLKDLDVFVNCPFDNDYQAIFHATVYTIVRSGYRARRALEADDAADNRLEKIYGIIAECKFGIHDISRTEADGDPPLPRFNMPLELGLFLGARRYGGRAQRAKVRIIFDRERFRFQRYISDIAGQDIHAHRGDVPTLIQELATWLRGQPGGAAVPGGREIAAQYVAFQDILPLICEARGMDVAEPTFDDFNRIVVEDVKSFAMP